MSYNCYLDNDWTCSQCGVGGTAGSWRDKPPLWGRSCDITKNHEISYNENNPYNEYDDDEEDKFWNSVGKPVSKEKIEAVLAKK